MRFEFGTLLIYSPRGTSPSAILSKKWLGQCKRGDSEFSRIVANRIKALEKEKYFNGAALIPVPRSSPVKPGSVFPSKVIAETLIDNNIGESVIECLKRTHAVPKSSGQYSADTRNSVDTHLDSLSVDNVLILEPTLILVDDVFTQGRTAMACALKLQEMFPEKKIKIFCPFRTRSFQEFEKFEVPAGGFMEFTPNRKVLLPD